MARDGERRGISRRQLLIGGGAGAGLIVAWRFWPRRYAPNLRAAEGEVLFNAYLKIGRDGHVAVAVPQTELGQGVYTSLPQILADELGADWRTIGVEPAPVSPLYANILFAEEAAAESGWPSALQGGRRWMARDFATRSALMLTGGSTSVRGFEAQLREAGAAARVLLCKAAAARWGANWEELDTRAGFVVRDNGRIPFADLAEAAPGYDLPDPLPLRAGDDDRLVGQPLPRLDAPAKIDGTALFAADVRFADMVYAAVRSGPWGSRLAAVDKAAANNVPGALRIFENPEWVAAVATNSWAAGRALDAIRPRFHLRRPLVSARRIGAALNEALDRDDGDRAFAAGDMENGFPGASPVSARYEVGLAPAAAIEPLTATARVLGDTIEVYAPTQAPGLARAAIARATGLAEDRVILFRTLAGGGYGRKLEMMAIEQAAIIAQQMACPVQLTWPRIQEIQRDSYRPAAAARMTGWLARGRLMGWAAKIAAPATAAEVAARIGVGSSLLGPTRAAVAGAMPPYAIPNVSVDHIPADIGVETGLWRGAAHSYTCYFTECFVDELARAAGLEPLAFRTFLLQNNPRLSRCLASATSIGGWDGGPPGSGMGLACHSAFGSHIACLVEVEVTGDQRLRVTRAVAAVDCGRVVNPEIVKQQIEGGIVHGVSAAVGRMIGFSGGIPEARTIGAYGLPVLRDAPDVSVEIMESDEAPGGVTELGVPPAAPAVANAFFSLTGQRVRSLPIVVGGGAPAMIGVLLVNLGTPDAADPRAVRRYLKEFLSDRRVVEIPAIAWQPILRGIILTTRPRKSARAYRQVWMAEGSPLAVFTARQAEALDGAFGEGVIVDHAMRYGRPAMSERIDALKAAGCERILIAPLYPQYCAATTATANDAAFAHVSSLRWQPALRTLPPYHDDPLYIGALKESLEASLAALDFEPETLVASFHGMPERTRDLGDPYHAHCLKTAALLSQAMGRDLVVAFQSRFGRAAWLEPATDRLLMELPGKGVTKLAIVAPGFAADCLETLEELAIRGRDSFRAAGGTHFAYLPCLNDSAPGMAMLRALLARELEGWLPAQ